MTAVRPAQPPLPSSTLAAALAVALLAPFLSLIGAPAFWRGEFFDADCFLRLDRVLALMSGGGWFDPVSHRTDSPFGEELHWTRPFDLLIWLGAWPLSGIMGSKPALEAFGAIVSPLLLPPTLALLRWGMAPTLGPRAVWGAVPFFLAQPQLLWVYVVGRPDHHSLLALCAAAVFAVGWRLAAGQADARHAAWGGAAAGLGVWVSVEGLVAAALGAALPGLLWLWRGGAAPPRWIAAYLAGFAACLAVAMAVEYPPSQWATLRLVKLSWVHLSLAVVAAATWGLVARLADADAPTPRRLAWCLLGAALPVAVLAAAAPAFFHGPLALHPAEAQAWSPTVGEMSPILPVDRNMMAVMLGQLGLAGLACGALLIRLWRGPAETRPLALAALLPTLAFAVVGLLQNRWSSYAQLAAVFPLLLAGRAIWRWPGCLRLGASQVPLRAPALAGFYCLPLILALALAAVMPEKPAPPPSSCPWPEAADALRRDHPPTPGADILFSHMFPGPELMWRGGYRVVAAPYISNTGIADSIRVFATADDAVARDILRRRQASLVLVCASDGEAREYRGEKTEYHAIVGLSPAPRGHSFHARLTRGEAPDWLEPLALPAEIEGMRLYRMR